MTHPATGSDTAGADVARRSRHRSETTRTSRSARPAALHALVIAVVVFVSGLMSTSFIYNSHFNGPMVRSDGFGYYAWVTSLVIDHDVSFETALAHSKGQNPESFLASAPTTGHAFDKYPPGAALLETPFFLAAHAYTLATHGAANGYSKPYEVANAVSAVSYLAFGAVVLFLLIFRRFGVAPAYLATLGIVYGTNLFHYGTYDGSFSHVYGFAATAVWLALLLRLRRSDGSIVTDPRLWALLGVTLGVIALIRVQSVLTGATIVPMALVLLRNRRAAVAPLLTFAACCAATFAPYLVFLQYTTGSFLTNPYQVLSVESYTNLTHPRLWFFLFGVDKGWFFWTPLVLVAVLSLISLWRVERGITIAFTAVLAIETYLCASWWSPEFGGSFGARPLIDLYPFLGLALAASVARVRVPTPLLAVALVPFVALTMVLMYGYWLGFVAMDGTTWNAYVHVFGNVLHHPWRPGSHLW